MRENIDNKQANRKENVPICGTTIHLLSLLPTPLESYNELIACTMLMDEKLKECKGSGFGALQNSMGPIISTACWPEKRPSFLRLSSCPWA